MNEICLVEVRNSDHTVLSLEFFFCFYLLVCFARKLNGFHRSFLLIIYYCVRYSKYSFRLKNEIYLSDYL